MANILAEATQNGTVTDAQADDFDRADPVLTGRTADGNSVYLVAEVSVTVNQRNVNRAQQRTAILQQATGGTAIPAVIGAAISDSNANHAAE